MVNASPTLNYTSADTDLGSGVYTTCANNHQVFIILYALSYGLNGTTIEYSTPVYLGFVGLTPFP